MSEPDLTRIIGGIYIGSVKPIIDHVPLGASYNITSILSIMHWNVVPEYLVRKNYQLKNIDIDDTENEDILQYFNETNKFIDQCLYPDTIDYNDKLLMKKPHKNSILVHCQAGVSRSVAFVVAYLMYRFNLSLDLSFRAVQRKRSGAQPNDNFMEQLKLYETMGKGQVDPNDKLYANWKFNHSIVNGTTNELLTDDSMYQDIVPKTTDEKDITVIRCKKCRQNLSLSTNFINHEPPSKESSEAHFIRRAGWGKRIIDIQESQNICSHFFTEPLNWMKDTLQNNNGVLEGRFDCPNCHVKVGGYNWKGDRCSCGKWVIPAIHLLSNKVDQFPLKRTELPNKVSFTKE